MKRIFTALFIFLFLFTQCVPVFAMDMASDFLCEIGIRYFNEGRITDALHELNKALLVNPDNETARRYIALIHREIPPAEALTGVSYKTAGPKQAIQESLDQMTLRMLAAERETVLPGLQPAKPKIKPGAKKAVDKYLDRIDREKRAAQKGPFVVPQEKAEKVAAPKKEIKIPELVLDEKAEALKAPVEIETGKSLVVRGKNFTRFLVTQPEILSVEKIDSTQLLVTGKNLGYTYLHIWDGDTRRTFEFRTAVPKAQGPTIEEELVSAEELAKNFKLRYSVDWTSFGTGRGLHSLKQTSSSWSHLLSLNGAIPYGKFDSSVAINSLAGTTDVTYYTAGLEQGKIGPFKDFSLRAFDFSPGFYNLSFSTGDLRGARFESPAFHRKLDYILFWGREGGGRYAGLSPGLAAKKDSYLSGMNLNISPDAAQSHNVSVYHGWGRDRQPDLKPYGYDVNGVYRFQPWGVGYDVAYDSDHFAYRLNSNYQSPQLNLSTELRNIEKRFRSSLGLGSYAGELGLLTNLSYRPREDLELLSRLDVYKDRLFPNEDDPDLWNQDLDSNLTFHFDPLTSASFNYAFQNLVGRVSPTRTYTIGSGLYKTFDWIRRIGTYIRYNYNINDNFNTPTSNYSSHRIYSGLRLNLTKNLDYYYNQEYDWVSVLKADGSATPVAAEMGLHWSSRIGKSPFYGNMRLTYRNEENTESPFSFLSGEDYVEYFGEISYSPSPDFTFYFNSRARNVWADNPKVNKRIDVDLNAGLRYFWDTGLRWEAIGSIEGFVFKDLNGDGLKEKDEPPVAGVKIQVGKKKTQVTNKAGFYKFGRVRATKATVAVDMSTIPSGYTLTVPGSQTVAIVQGKKERVDFGVAVRTEITGIVFEDIEGTGQLSQRSVGIKGVVLTLEDGTRATTDDFGRYEFKQLSAGKHKATLDLKTVPAVYIPTIPIFKEIELTEGMGFTFNIPLKKTK